MGIEESQPIPPDSLPDDIKGKIPQLNNILFDIEKSIQNPNELLLSPEAILESIRLLKTYYQSLAYHINQNESKLTSQINQQIEKYIILAQKLNSRRATYNEHLKNVTTQIKDLSDAVKQTTDNLSLSIRKADQLAQSIDPNMSLFQID